MEDDLAGLLKVEEIYWKQRSREDWLKWGIATLGGSIKKHLFEGRRILLEEFSIKMRVGQR